MAKNVELLVFVMHDEETYPDFYERIENDLNTKIEDGWELKSFSPASKPHGSIIPTWHHCYDLNSISLASNPIYSGGKGEIITEIYYVALFIKEK